ncbi:fungal hydrophobin-domain-containing protein [Nemania sp. FL0916]|nr:fungal hydrophobin-domain-containing protein [Nemania sp. FL0916]
MQFTVIVAALFAAAVSAGPLDMPVAPRGKTYSATPTTTKYPSGPTGTPYKPCPAGLYSVPQCCATDILGLADLDCHSPSAVPSSPADFRYICAAGGQRARCCVVPVLGQAVLCETPAGV